MWRCMPELGADSSAHTQRGSRPSNTAAPVTQLGLAGQGLGHGPGRGFYADARRCVSYRTSPSLAWVPFPHPSCPLPFPPPWLP